MTDHILKVWKHWHLERADNDIAWLLFDKQDSSVNVLSAEVLEELDEVLSELETEGSKPRVLALRSVKAAGFCMGADISEFSTLKSEGEVVEKLSRPRTR